jgi:hypothetical protein
MTLQYLVIGHDPLDQVWRDLDHDERGRAVHHCLGHHVPHTLLLLPALLSPCGYFLQAAGRVPPLFLIFTSEHLG